MLFIVLSVHKTEAISWVKQHSSIQLNHKHFLCYMNTDYESQKFWIFVKCDNTLQKYINLTRFLS